MHDSLIDIFHASNGVVCCVGAGGKKTTMFRLAREHTGRVGITATAHTEYFPKTLEAECYIAEEETLIDQVLADTSSRVIAFAQPSPRHGRRAGVSATAIERLKQSGHFDLLVVKADGARSRFLKAPAEHEPPIPDCTDVVVPVVSARIIGKPLSTRYAHRIEHLTALTGLKENDEILPVHVARVLASPDGSLKNATHASVIPLINMVDNDRIAAVAREAAINALSLTDRFDTVVLASMCSDNPVIEVVVR